jgi:hypothetical protein
MTEKYSVMGPGEGEMRITSFSDETKDYLVSLSPLSCECMHHVRTGARCRHLLVARCIERIRRSAFGTSIDIEAAREIVSRVLNRTNRLDESYEAMNAARSFRFGTSELRKIASRRHRENVRRELARLEAA